LKTPQIVKIYIRSKNISTEFCGKRHFFLLLGMDISAFDTYIIEGERFLAEAISKVFEIGSTSL
jgi:hypothetical protein